MKRAIAIIAAVAAATIALPIGAQAQSPVETAIAEWVAAIDATPGWDAGYRSLSYDSARDEAVLSGLSVSSASLGLDVALETITVTGFAQDPDNGFSASSVTVDAGAADAGVVKIAVSDIALNGLKVPSFGGLTWDRKRPFTSMIRAYAPAVAIEMSDARIGLVSIVEELQDVTSRISYENIVLDDWSGGRIKTMRAGPLRMESPAPEGLVNMTFASVEANNANLDAMIRVYDPDRYVGGIGDGIWRSAMESASYRDIVIDAPGAKVTIDGIAMENLKVRQPRESFASFFDLAMVDPDRFEKSPDAGRQALNMMSAFSFGQLSLSEFDVDAVGIDRMHLGRFSMTDVSIDGLGEMAIEDLDGAIEGEGYVKVGRFAFGGMDFPSLDTILEAMAAEESGSDFDTKRLVPTLGFLEASAIDVESTDVPRVQLGQMRVDLANYVGSVPTLVGVDVAGVDMAVSAIDDAKARKMLSDLGYERINVDYAVQLAWDEPSEKVTIDGFRAAIADMGSITGTAELAGLTRSALEDVDTLGTAIEDLDFVRGSFTFEDDSIVDRGLAMQAAQMNLETDVFREQIAGALPFMITFVGNPAFQKQLAPALQTLLRTPGSITVTAMPTTPIALSAIADAADNAPQSLPDLLSVTVSAVGGAAPETTGGEMVAPPENGNDGGNGDSDAAPPTEEDGAAAE